MVPEASNKIKKRKATGPNPQQLNARRRRSSELMRGSNNGAPSWQPYLVDPDDTADGENDCTIADNAADRSQPSVCVVCGHRAVFKRPFSRNELLLSLVCFPLGIALCLLLKRRCCMHCGGKFRS